LNDVLFDLENSIKKRLGLVPSAEIPAKKPEPEKVEPSPAEQKPPETQPAPSIIPTHTPEQIDQMPPYSPNQTRTAQVL
jgi:hypothetical protein